MSSSVKVARSLIRKFNTSQKPSCDITLQRPVVIRYMHGVAHILKKVAQRYNVPVVFSVPNKMSRLCRRINNPKPIIDPCSTKHRNKHTHCTTGVVHEIPMTCGLSYVGQTGRYVNDRAREHAAFMRATPSGNLAVHCSRCPCAASFKSTKSLAKYKKKKVSRELHKAFEIRARVNKCVSKTSLALSTDE